MTEGEWENGVRVLRAKIDMASPNINMRDPVIYRIIHINHHQTGDKWCIYPMYDFAHPLQDSFEGITHSLCSLEYEDHRTLYDWVINNCDVKHKPRQIEFGRLGITNMIMSKRYLKNIEDVETLRNTDTKIYVENHGGYYKFINGFLCYFHSDGKDFQYQVGLWLSQEPYIEVEDEPSEDYIGMLGRFWDNDESDSRVSFLEEIEYEAYKDAHG